MRSSWYILLGNVNWECTSDGKDSGFIVSFRFVVNCLLNFKNIGNALFDVLIVPKQETIGGHWS